jgi:hypothetical protein
VYLGNFTSLIFHGWEGWNAMIYAYPKNGYYEKAIVAFDQM